MAQISVAQFADSLGMPATSLLEQLKKAGVSKSAPDELLTEQDKSRLLDFLRRAHGAAESRTKITLTRILSSLKRSVTIFLSMEFLCAVGLLSFLYPCIIILLSIKFSQIRQPKASNTLLPL